MTSAEIQFCLKLFFRKALMVLRPTSTVHTHTRISTMMPTVVLSIIHLAISGSSRTVDRYLRIVIL